MKTRIITLIGILMIPYLYSFSDKSLDGLSLTFEVESLRNSNGNVLFALYNKNSSIPDEHYKNYLKNGPSKIVGGKAMHTFYNLPEGKYAVNILHDENKNSKIDKGFIVPIEGIGFSNFQSIGIANRPNFTKASFDLNADKKMHVKVIYM